MDALFTNRREFIRVSTSAMGGMWIGFSLPFDRAKGKAPLHQGGRIGYFVEISPDNHITLHIPKPEIGQGVHTSMSMLIAEELEVDLENISVEQLPVRLVRNPANTGFTWLHGSQNVGGSTSISDTWDMLRQVGAEARERLLRAAGEIWHVDHATLEANSGRVTRPDGAVLTYGELAAMAATLPESAEPAQLKDPIDFKLIGTPQRMVHAERIVTGSAEFGIDGEIPGTLHAVIERAPRLGAKLVSFDAGATLAIPGVRHVVSVEGPERSPWEI